jgi:8-oxo-dGTP diphosphatase
MDEQQVMKKIKELAEKLPKLPDGRIDYSNSALAPVLTVFVKHGNKILLLKRSDRVSTYKGKWNTVAGYLDEPKPIREKIMEEVKEETGLDESVIKSIHTGEPYEFTDNRINKTWLIHPALVELNAKAEIKLDWEHTEYRWMRPEELEEYNVVPNLGKSYGQAQI